MLYTIICIFINIIDLDLRYLARAFTYLAFLFFFLSMFTGSDGITRRNVATLSQIAI